MITKAINEFTHTLVKDGGDGWDIVVTLNGKRTLIGHATRYEGSSGYVLVAYSLSQFPATLAEAAETQEWLSLDAMKRGGLTLAEVRQRAATLAGIWLAGKAIA